MKISAFDKEVLYRTAVADCHAVLGIINVNTNQIPTGMIQLRYEFLIKERITKQQLKEQKLTNLLRNPG